MHVYILSFHLYIALTSLDNNHRRFPKRTNLITDDGVVPSQDHINRYSENLYSSEAVKSESINGHRFLTMESDPDDDCLFSINLCSDLLAADTGLHCFSAEYTNDIFQLSMDSDAESVEMASPSQRMWFDPEYEDDDDDEEEEEGDDLFRSLQEEQEEFTMVLSPPSPVPTNNPYNGLVCKIPSNGFTNLSSGNYTLHHPSEHATSSSVDMAIFNDKVPNKAGTISSDELKHSHLSLNDKIISDSRIDIDLCKSPKSQDDGHVVKKDTEYIVPPVSILPDMLNNHNVSLY